MTDEFLYLELVEACGSDKSQILAVAEAALTHINAHAEAAVIQQVLEKNNWENSQVDALFQTAFGASNESGANLNASPAKPDEFPRQAGNL